jgi:hypothetical protein
MPESLVLGTGTYDASGDALRRQQNAVASMRALQRVEILNVQFRTAPHEVDGLPTLRALGRDSTTATGRRGPRKPLVSDLFNVLCHEAEHRGARYFGFTNADIQISQAAIDWVLEGTREAYVFSREDFNLPSGMPAAMMVYGADVFVIGTRWWREHRHRFRSYILGESVWDNVYASILMCHADAVIENRRPLVRHEAHPLNWSPSGPFSAYHQMLAAYDATYFSLWCDYVHRLLELRQRGSSHDEECEMARRTFRWPPSTATRAVQAARNVKAFVRYRLSRIRG